MWRRIEDAFTPNSEELKRTERELARLRIAQGTEPVPGQAAEGVCKRSRSRNQHRRIALMAAALVVTISAIGWVNGSFWILPEPYSPAFQAAGQSLRSSQSEDRAWRANLGYMASHHASSTAVLVHLSHEESAIGEAAAQALQRFIDNQLASSVNVPGNLLEVARTACNQSASTASRDLAVQQLESFMLGAEQAIAEADASSELRVKMKIACEGAIQSRRGQARDGTHVSGLPSGTRGERTKMAPEVPLPEGWVPPNQQPEGNAPNVSPDQTAPRRKTD